MESRDTITRGLATKLTAVVVLLAISTSDLNLLRHAYAETRLSYNEIVEHAKSEAVRMAFAYQRGLNCGMTLKPLSPEGAGGLIINYVEPKDMQGVMNEYYRGQNMLKAEKCNRDALKHQVIAIESSLREYILQMQPYMRP